MIRKILIFPFIIGIRFYQKYISPLLPPSCRFQPTCSTYCLDVLRKYGLLKGLYYSIQRLIRCNPWGGHGCDPVP